MINAKTLFKLILPRGSRRDYPSADTLIIQPKVDASVTRQPNNDLFFEWTLDAPLVEIFAGTNPDPIDETFPVARVEGEKVAVVLDLDPAIRYYFELVFTDGATITRRKVAERALPLAGGVNFRDIRGVSDNRWAECTLEIDSIGRAVIWLN